MLRHVLPALLALLPLLGVATAAGPSPPLLLAHLMPWYEAPPTAGWGWHWTMNHYRPDSVAAGRRPIASRFYPVIGPYHSGDEHVIEYQLLLMRLAGIDGLILDWYGHVEHLDYGVIHRNSERIVAAANRLGMKVAVCYEDRTLATLEAAGKLAGDREAHVAAEIEWLAKAWFPLECYVRLDGKPIDFPTALVRSLGTFFGVAALGLGYFWAAWDEERQGWHDKLAGTVVVRVPKVESLV